MSIVEVLRNQNFFKNISKKCESGTMPAATLFFCEDAETARISLILTALAMQYPQTYQLFDEKSAEFVRVNGGADLDIKVFPKGDKLLVDDSAEIVGEASVKPVNMPFKIFIINGIDKSTEAAQNKLLKIIEEPPKNVRFLISAANEQRVLPTIKSRCEKVKIAPLSFEEISSLCKDNLAVVLGGGYIGRTLTLSQNPDVEKLVKLGISVVTDLKTSKQVLQFSKEILDCKDNLKLILEVLQIALEDVMKLKCESEKLCKFISFKSALKSVEPEYSVMAICEICKLVSHFMEKVEFNANMAVAIDNFLLKILEVKYLCK